MLNILLLGFLGAFICTLVTSGIGIIIHKKEDSSSGLTKRIIMAIISFLLNSFWMIILLYCSCLEQTFFAVIRWIWQPLTINAFIFYCISLTTLYELISNITLAIISVLICLSVLFSPVQNLIFVHDMANIDIAYSVTSDEILAKIDLNIDNSLYSKDYFDVDTPEIRKVNDEFIAVYHIKNKSGYENVEYIPGYAIQQKGSLPKIISKRIYFDTSFYNKKDALRTIRRKYPTVIISEHKFDIDDEWNPYEIYQYRESIFSTDGNDYGLIILNLSNGTCEKYPAAENNIPDWVDFETTYPR